MLTTVSFKRSIASGLLAVLGALAATTTSHAQVGLFSTGVDDSNTVLATGAVDIHYTLLAGYPSSTVYAVNDAEGFPGYWMAPSAASKWITPVISNGTASGAFPSLSSFQYQTTFDLTGIDLLTASISGKATADNAVLGIKINGIDIGFSSSGYSTFSSFVISSGFQTGINTLIFTVENWSGPTGLRTELAGSFERLPVSAVPEPETYAMMLAGLGLVGSIVRRRKGRQV
ncbi:MAG: hypothetical protein RL081_1009 [Pseudomonadota bacterium]